MNTLYLDLVSGISGDMFVGALLDLGADAVRLEQELAKLGLQKEYHLHVLRSQKNGIAGTKFNVHLQADSAAAPAHGPEHHHGPEHGHEHAHSHEHGTHTHFHDEVHGRTFAQIRTLIAQSSLSDWVKQKATAVFHRLALAEGQIHGMAAEEVTFHEVGAVDSIVDIVGACIGLELLGQPRLEASAVVDGNGWMECAHGRFPIPAPATLAVLGGRGIPLTQCSEPQELVTPTGAALLAELAESFGPMTGLAAQKIGYGLGTRDNKTRPNVLRAVLGVPVKETLPSVAPAQQPRETEPCREAHDWETDTVAVLETNLDNISAETLGYFLDKALAAGALDVFHTPIQMKKNRPGVLLTVLCAETEADKFSELMLRETTALGVRRHLAERRKLRREFVPVQTPWGQATLKLGRLDGEVVQAAPEFESCKRLAELAGVPLREVHAAVLAGWKRQG